MKMLRTFPQLIATCTLMVATAVGAGNGTGKGDLPDPTVVKLPPYLVEDSKHVLNWRYASLPGFEVLSTCSARNTEQFLESFYLVDRAFHLFVPEDLTFRSSIPLTILLLDQKDQSVTAQIAREAIESEGQRVTRSQLPGLPELNVGLGLPSSPPRADAPVTRRATGELRFLPNLRLTDSDSYMMFTLLDTFTFDPGGLSFAPEQVSFLLDYRSPPLPRWFVDGVQTLYSRATLRHGGITFGRGPMLVAERYFSPTTDIASSPLMEVFTQSEPILGVELRERAGRAAVFIRWAMQTETTREALWRFVRLASQVRPTEQAFAECFGRDVRAVEQDFSRLDLVRPLTLRVGRTELAVNARSRAATNAEAARILGDWHRRAARYLRAKQPEVADKYLTQALRLMERAYDQGERDPGLLAVYGLARCEADDDTAALPLLEAAVAANVPRPRAYDELARIRYAQAVAKSTLKDKRLEGAQVEAIVSVLRRGRAFAPASSAGYELEAEVWMHSAESPRSADLAALDEGVRLFPTDRRLREAMVSLSGAKMGAR